MLIACVNRNASGHVAIRTNGSFCVNLLSIGHEETAAIFSGQRGLAGDARFDANWRVLATGAPVLEGALANFDCRLVQEHEFSTHSIFIGAVEAMDTAPDLRPLMYFDGAFRSLSL